MRQRIALVGVPGAGADQFGAGRPRLGRADRVHRGPAHRPDRVADAQPGRPGDLQPGDHPGTEFLVVQRWRSVGAAGGAPVQDRQRGRQHDLHHPRGEQAAGGVADHLDGTEGLRRARAVPQSPGHRRWFAAQQVAGVGLRLPGRQLFQDQWRVDPFVERQTDEDGTAAQGAEVGGRLGQQRQPQRLVHLGTDVDRHRIGRQRVRRHDRGGVELRLIGIGDPGPGESVGTAFGARGAGLGLLRCLARGDQLERPDIGLVVGLEPHRAGGRGSSAEHLDPLRLLGGDGQQHRGRPGGPRSYAEQPEELHLGRVGDLVEPEQQRLAQEGEEFQQRDARIGLVVIGPFRVVHRDPAQQLLPQLVVAAVVEDGRDQGHRYLR